MTFCIFDHQQFSEVEISQEHIELLISFLYALADPHTTDLFWWGPHYLRLLAEKQWQCGDRLGALEVWFGVQCVPNGCIH